MFVGGESRRAQLGDFRRGRKDIIVATPGRLNDLLSEPIVRQAIEKTDMLVLDEADTLLEMGFKKELADIISHLPSSRQTFLFSATVSPAIAQIARASLKPNHLMIDCVPKNESNVHLHIPQYFATVPAEQQLSHVIKLIAHDQLTKPDSKIILFLPTTKMTMLTATLLRELKHLLPRGTELREIHSQLSQDRRTRASDRFRKDSRPSILVTSDVSARGVDYPGLTRVIQVGVPTTPEQYIHRVGRTGRAGKAGGRGDLVLLPWETGYLNGMKAVPIQENTGEDLASALAEVAPDTYQATMATIDKTVKEFLPTLDPEAVNEVFTSLLGYYAGRKEQLNIGAGRLVQEVKDWAVEAGGLDERPHVGENMLAKMGLKERGGRGGFGGGGGRGGFGGRGGGGGGRFGGGGGFGGRRDGGEGGGFARREGGGGGFGRSEGGGGYQGRNEGGGGGYRPRGDSESGGGGGFMGRSRDSEGGSEGRFGSGMRGGFRGGDRGGGGGRGGFGGSGGEFGGRQENDQPWRNRGRMERS